MLKIISFFHINTSFSSLEYKSIPEVIKKCYWPLLNLIEKNERFKISIEANGKSLEDIYNIDPAWIKKLAFLLKHKKCEFIGSGYIQMINPSVPQEITEKNIKFGFEIYLKYLNYKPNLALINEQVFSKSLINIYKKYFKGIFIDWINAKQNISLKIKKDQKPSYALDDYGNKISVIWTNSLAFQKFQRFIFGEIDSFNYLNYLKNQKDQKLLCIYSNDCEIFNFRPKRFSTEINLIEDEWKKIIFLYNLIEKNLNLKFYFPSETLNFNDKKKLIINSATYPIIAKKQPKYNISRWLISGKNNFDLNKKCWKLYYQLKKKKESSKNKWKKLCEYWSSDLRTHCTKKKYNNLLKNLNKDLGHITKTKKEFTKKYLNKIMISNEKNIKENENFITFENKKTKIILNKKKGLTVDSFIVKKISEKSLFGTLYSGSIKNMKNQSDFFSGHFNLFDNNLEKITDLSISKKNYEIFKNKNKNFFIEFSHKFSSKLEIKKKLEIDLSKSKLYLKVDLKNFSPRILRAFNTTINPDAFEKKNLMIFCKNGGDKLEKFTFENDFNHGEHIQDVTKFTSSSNCLSMTDGKLIIRDKKKQLMFSFDKAENPLVGLIEFKNLKDKYFLRNSFSMRESDDTFKMTKFSHISLQIKIEAKKL